MSVQKYNVTLNQMEITLNTMKTQHDFKESQLQIQMEQQGLKIS